MSVPPIEAVGALAALEPSMLAAGQTAGFAAPGGTSFARMLLDGVGQVDARLQDADAIARAFVLDDSIPVHQVTYALERARMSLELMLQVRARLVEGYQELMRMQL